MTITVNPDWWKRLFDDIYLVTDARSVCNPDITRLEVDLVCDLLNPARHNRILDLCGGQGRHLFELYRRGYRQVTLADYSATLITKAQRLAKIENLGIEVLRCDARQTGLRKGRENARPIVYIPLKRYRNHRHPCKCRPASGTLFPVFHPGQALSHTPVRLRRYSACSEGCSLSGQVRERFEDGRPIPCPECPRLSGDSFF